MLTSNPELSFALPSAFSVMDRPPPLILPEGFVRNTDEIYQEVASFDIIPPEQLWKYWHVYTTTFRRLIDPTASRLENFWWHVLGSDRRFLSGKALAKIYKQISNEPSFVPLRRPSNRLDGRATTRSSGRRLDGAGSDAPPHSEQEQGNGQGSEKSTADKVTREPTSSSSRPPPIHPILKKSRGPSASGPRPTARFISPHESEEEAAKDAETSSGSTGGTGLEMQRGPAPLSAKSEKKSTPTGRKFIASSSASRRRPALGRRQSSQSSAISETSTKVASSGSKSSAGSAVGSLDQTIVGSQTMTGSQASSNNSTLVQSPVMSSKAAGKRPMRGPSNKDNKVDRSNSQSVESPGRPVIVQQQQQAPARTPQFSSGQLKNTPEPSYEPNRSWKDPSGEAPSASPAPASRERLVPPTMTRSQSNIETPQQRLRETGSSRRTPPCLITPSVAVPTQAADVAVQVQFDNDKVTVPGDGTAPRDIPDNVAIASRPSTSSLFTPTQPSPTPDIPLGRSKSQLTLLLERDKDRVGDLQARKFGREDKERRRAP